MYGSVFVRVGPLTPCRPPHPHADALLARTSAKPKAAPAKKKKKSAKGKAKRSAGAAKPKVERKEYPIVGQKRDTPEEGESLRKFYLSLRAQIPGSEMAEVWLMEHGLLSEDEAQVAYKRMLKRKGKTAPAAAKRSGGGGAKKTETKAPKAEKRPSKPAVAGAKRKGATIDDDDSDDDAPLASLKAKPGGGSGFKIPKKE
jgi:hypothetical protein